MRIKYKLIIILGILSLFLTTSCSSNQTDFTNQMKTVKPTCEDQVKQVIPNSIFLVEQDSGSYSYALLPEINQWANGHSISGQTRYRQGNRKGENTFYYYPEFWNSGVKLVNPGIAYGGGQVVDEEGIILGRDSFRVDLVVKPLDNTEEQFFDEKKDRYFSKKLFEVVDYKIYECVSSDLKINTVDPDINTR